METHHLHMKGNFYSEICKLLNILGEKLKALTFTSRGADSSNKKIMSVVASAYLEAISALPLTWSTVKGSQSRLGRHTQEQRLVTGSHLLISLPPTDSQQNSDQCCSVPFNHFPLWRNKVQSP